MMNSNYKKSEFNYICKTKKGYLIYNTLYNSLSRVCKDEYKQYKELSFISEDILHQFLNQGIIVKKNVDELQKYNAYIKMIMKHSKFPLCLTVTPTMECNARCFYCYENGVKCGSMDKESALKIVQMIKSLCTNEKIQITWFGGEPLMNQEWMDYFSECLNNENIAFSAFMISNGSKIDDTAIVKMKTKWNVKSIQLTFDGSWEEYIKRKSYVDQDEYIYYRLLDNIRKLSKAGIQVQVRLNIDKDNIESIKQMVENLVYLYREDSNVTCYPAFLTGTVNQLTEREKIDVIKQIIEIGENKVPINNYLYKMPKTTACYYNRKNAFSIDTNGDIFICEHMLGHKEKAIGNISDNLDFSMDIRELSGQRIECQKCVFFPKCLGGCTDTYYNGEIPCFIDKYIIQAYLELL